MPVLVVSLEAFVRVCPMPPRAHVRPVHWVLAEFRLPHVCASTWSWRGWWRGPTSCRCSRPGIHDSRCHDAAENDAGRGFCAYGEESVKARILPPIGSLRQRCSRPVHPNRAVRSSTTSISFFIQVRFQPIGTAWVEVIASRNQLQLIGEQSLGCLYGINSAACGCAVVDGPVTLGIRHRDRLLDTACRARLMYCPLAGSP